jgi:hypothetical protein
VINERRITEECGKIFNTGELKGMKKLNAFLFFVPCMNNVLYLIFFYFKYLYFTVGAKVRYFFNLLQAKAEKITIRPEDLTFAIIKVLLNMYNSTICNIISAGK